MEGVGFFYKYFSNLTAFTWVVIDHTCFFSVIMSRRSGPGASKMDQQREKVIQDRLQLLLSRMLQEEDNKYCVDCDAKGMLEYLIFFLLFSVHNQSHLSLIQTWANFWTFRRVLKILVLNFPLLTFQVRGGLCGI